MAFDGKQIRNATVVGAKLANLTVTSAQLAPDSVTTAKIANLAVEGAKLANASVIEAKLADSAVTGVKLADGAVLEAKLADSAVSSGKLADNAVVSAKIAANAVSEAKLADDAVSTSKLVDGAVSEAKLVDGAVSSVKLADTAVSEAKLADNAVTSAKLAVSAVTEAKIATGAVSANKLASDSVVESKIADGAVTAAKLAPGAISDAQIADGSITFAKLADGAVSGAKIADGGVGGLKIADNAITTGKILDGAVTGLKLGEGSVSGNKILAGAVAEDKLADGAVTTAKLAATGGAEAVTTETIRGLAVTTPKVADAAIVEAKLADGAVTTAKLADSAVNAAKIADATITGGKIAADTVAAANLVTAYESSLLYRDGSRAMAGALDLGTGNKIVNLANPTQAQDAATKAYVDSITSSLDLKASVHAATDEAIALDNTTTAVDGVLLADGDRVLVKDQASAAENGIWTVSTSGPWSRASDADTNEKVSSGMFTFVEDGDANANTGWVLTTDGPITVGTTALAFTQFSGAGSYLAGFGLNLTGNEFSVAFNDNPATVAPVGATAAQGASNLVARADHAHILADSAVTTAKLADGAVTYEKIDEEAFTPITDWVEDSFLSLGGHNGPFQGTLEMGGYAITDVADALLAGGYTQDVVNQRSLLWALERLSFKAPVSVSTTENVVLSGEQTIDGVTVGSGFLEVVRVLVKDQTDPTENGIYETGTGAWSRTLDFGAGGSNLVLPGSIVTVRAGTENGYGLWMVVANSPRQIGIDAVHFARINPSVLSALANADTDISVNLQKIVDLADPTDDQDAVTKAYVDAQVSVAGGGLTVESNVAEVTSADGDLASANGMGMPAKGSVQVFVNGIQVNLTGDLLGDCYFSADSGVTPKSLFAVVANDRLYWNGSIAEYQLDASDRIDFVYIPQLELS